MMSEPVTGYIHSTESFGSVDGPGIPFCNLHARLPYAL